METLGERVRRLRGAKPRDRVARAAGLTTDALWRLESGRTLAPRYDTIEGLARALEVPIDELLEVAPVVNADTVVPESANARLSRRIHDLGLSVEQAAKKARLDVMTVEELIKPGGTSDEASVVQLINAVAKRGEDWVATANALIVEPTVEELAAKPHLLLPAILDAVRAGSFTVAELEELRTALGSISPKPKGKPKK